MTEEEYQTIRARWDFKLPVAYLKMHELGLVRSNADTALVLSDTSWLSGVEIGDYSDPLRDLDSMVPFAKSGRGDLWCWYLKPAAGRSLVVQSPAQSAFCTGYAPNFEGAIYRLLLEEFSSTWLVGKLGDADAVAQRFMGYAAEVAPFLPFEWSARLSDIASRPLLPQLGGNYGFLSPVESNEIVQQHLVFEQLHERIYCRVS